MKLGSSSDTRTIQHATSLWLRYLTFNPTKQIVMHSSTSQHSPRPLPDRESEASFEFESCAHAISSRADERDCGQLHAWALLCACIDHEFEHSASLGSETQLPVVPRCCICPRVFLLCACGCPAARSPTVLLSALPLLLFLCADAATSASDRECCNGLS